ncbi:MAG: hypothetical protein WC729_29645 [Sphingomonas sp.]|jgi:hypothetical protein|uniref:hypothetical protein n=1 Tax=Sphingomonas sp. TaxID=28214 RepID=UPI0035698C9E
MNTVIKIVSGEGQRGQSVTYEGALTVRALKARITKEKAGGDRWARIEVATQYREYETVTAEQAIAAVEAELVDEVQPLTGGRYIVARWQNSQWTSSDLNARSLKHQTGYQFTYARTLEQLVNLGIKTYKTRAQALAAAGRG